MNGSLALTWVPNPKNIGVKPEYQFQNTISTLIPLMKCTEDIQIYPELTANGNIHYHMQFKLKDKIKYYKKALPTLKYNGFVQVKTKVDAKWIEYCKKDVDTMRGVLGIEIPINIENYTKSRKEIAMKCTTKKCNILDYIQIENTPQ